MARECRGDADADNESKHASHTHQLRPVILIIQRPQLHRTTRLRRMHEAPLSRIDGHVRDGRTTDLEKEKITGREISHLHAARSRVLLCCRPRNTDAEIVVDESYETAAIELARSGGAPSIRSAEQRDGAHRDLVADRRRRCDRRSRRQDDRRWRRPIGRHRASRQDGAQGEAHHADSLWNRTLHEIAVENAAGHAKFQGLNTA